MPLISVEMDACDDRCQRTLHRACPRPGLDDPLDRARRPDRHGHLQHRGMPDAAPLQGRGRAAGVRRSARGRPCAGGHRPCQRLVPLWFFTVRRPPRRGCPLRGRRGTRSPARSPRRTRLDARRGLRGMCPVDPQRPGPGPRSPVLTREPAARRAGAGAPGVGTRTVGRPRWLLLTHRPAHRGPDPPAAPPTPHCTPRSAPRPGELSEGAGHQRPAVEYRHPGVRSSRPALRHSTTSRSLTAVTATASSAGPGRTASRTRRPSPARLRTQRPGPPGRRLLLGPPGPGPQRTPRRAGPSALWGRPVWRRTASPS